MLGRKSYTKTAETSNELLRHLEQFRGSAADSKGKAEKFKALVNCFIRGYKPKN